MGFDFAKLDSLLGLGMRTTLTFFDSFGIWPIANKLLYILIVLDYEIESFL